MAVKTRGARLAGAAFVLSHLAVLLSTGVLGRAFVDGPPAGVTGGFNDVSCHQCHFDYEPGSPGGRLSIEGLPDVFEPGATYPLTVTLSRDGLNAGGFQLALRFADGGQRGRKAGELRSPDPRARVAQNERRDAAYAQHTKSGTEPTGAGVASWTLEWTAPADGGTVALHVAAVAGDGDLSPFGDFVYLAEMKTRSR